MADSRTVQLPIGLCTAVERKFEGVFGSLEELLVFVLADLANDDSIKADQAEQQLIEERLRDLGYL